MGLSQSPSFCSHQMALGDEGLGLHWPGGPSASGGPDLTPATLGKSLGQHDSHTCILDTKAGLSLDASLSSSQLHVRS